MQTFIYFWLIHGYGVFKISYKTLKIDTDTNDMIDKCVAEFLRHHPELKKMKISRNKILYEIAEYYLKT